MSADDIKAEIGPVEYRLPLPPAANNIYFNLPRGGRAKTSQYVMWLESAMWQLKAQKARQFPARAEIQIEVDDTVAGDIDGRTKAVLDALVKAGVLEDDSKKFVLAVSTRWAPVEGCVVRIRGAG